MSMLPTTKQHQPSLVTLRECRGAQLLRVGGASDDPSLGHFGAHLHCRLVGADGAEVVVGFDTWGQSSPSEIVRKQHSYETYQRTLTYYDLLIGIPRNSGRKYFHVLPIHSSWLGIHTRTTVSKAFQGSAALYWGEFSRK